eukprot:scaffold1430_cov257-Pinguiococcus_pyrenoidosus.AAC.16
MKTIVRMACIALAASFTRPIARLICSRASWRRTSHAHDDAEVEERPDREDVSDGSDAPNFVGLPGVVVLPLVPGANQQRSADDEDHQDAEHHGPDHEGREAGNLQDVEEEEAEHQRHDEAEAKDHAARHKQIRDEVSYVLRKRVEAQSALQIRTNDGTRTGPLRLAHLVVVKIRQDDVANFVVLEDAAIDHFTALPKRHAGALLKERRKRCGACGCGANVSRCERVSACPWRPTRPDPGRLLPLGCEAAKAKAVAVDGVDLRRGGGVDEVDGIQALVARPVPGGSPLCDELGTAQLGVRAGASYPSTSSSGQSLMQTPLSLLFT